MFSFCVDQVSKMEYKPEGEECSCRRNKDDSGGSGKIRPEEASREKKVSSPAALGSMHEQVQGKNSHFFGRAKKVSAPPSAQFEALLSAACHLREKERKKSAHEPAPGHHSQHHHHIFQQRHQSQAQHHHANNHLQRHLAHHHEHQHSQHDHNHRQLRHRSASRESLQHHAEDDGGESPVPPQRRSATHGERKERKKGSVMTPPTLEQLQAAVLEEAAKHGKKNTGPAHPLNIFGRTKKVSAPPVAQFEALLAANAKVKEDRERKRSVHAPSSNQHHQHQHYGNLHHHHHHQAQRLDNLHIHSPEPALLSQRKCIAAGQKKRSRDEQDHRLDGLWITRCEGDVGRSGSRTPAEIMAHELDSALAAVARRRKEMSGRAGGGGGAGGDGGGQSGSTPAEALAAEMNAALAAALIRRERKLTVQGHGKEWSHSQGTAGGGRNHLHRSTEMLSRG